MGLKNFLKNLFSDDTPVVTSTPASFSPKGTIEHTRFFARVAEAVSFCSDVHLYITHDKTEDSIKFKIYSFDFIISIFHILTKHGISESELRYLMSLNTSSDYLDAVHIIHLTDDNTFNASYYAELIRKFNPSATLRIMIDGIFADTREK